MIADRPAQPNAEDIRREFLENLTLIQGTTLERATPNDCYLALAVTVRQYLVGQWLETRETQVRQGAKVVAYLSAEYLLGRQLGNTLLNTDLEPVVREALNELGLDLDALAALEVEPGLGNGGLGRLAACFVDSLATLGYPAIGYGIRYEYGIFRQRFEDGWQIEQPDNWLSHGEPWSFARPERAVEVGFGGRTVQTTDADGGLHVRWQPERWVRGVPYNLLVPGYRSGAVNTLRLWAAQANQAFDLEIFNDGDYERAVHAQTQAENISKVLYPDDSTEQGRELRLQQQYFFTACSLQDLIRERLASSALAYLPDRVAVQLNDTHPTIAIPELMRLLLDEHRMGWEAAWDISSRVFAYTCHTLLPEALETWPVSLFERLLPRHLEIILEINARFLKTVRQRFPGDEDRARRMSIIAEEPERRVRMAHLAAVGCFKVNGVAELHSKLLRERVLNDFADLWPEKFTNVTNGVTPRRFVRLSNPALSELITHTIGDGWLRDLEQLRKLEPFAEDPDFRGAWLAVKRQNKARLAQTLATSGLHVSADALRAGAMLDVIVKRLHEYKRQLLKLLHVIALYQRLQADPGLDVLPRVVLFGAKAAPGYRMAKLIIRLIHGVGEVVNNDPMVKGRLSLAFPANYNVSLAEFIYPAADVSEQISLAGKEASGTGNMKLALNGAVTIGTLDGANVEIRDAVGEDNFFLFGLTEPEVIAAKAQGYDPRRHVDAEPELRAAIDAISQGHFSRGDKGLFEPIVRSLLERDEYMVLTDFAPYIAAQDALEDAYRDEPRWTRMSILNVARSGHFSSDRTIRQYAENVWGLQAVLPTT